MAEKIINILDYTNKWDNTKYLRKGILSFQTVDEAFDYFEDIRQKTKSFEIWAYPYIEEYEGVVEFVNRSGEWCETNLVED